MVNLIDLVGRLQAVKILVIGDILLDTYTHGQTRRVSPEAPVVIINVKQEEHRPGGAGNVALNLISLGAHVTFFGRVGQDWAGEFLERYLISENIDVSGLVVQQGYATPIKNRVIADHQQIVRIDREEFSSLSPELEQEIIDSLDVALQDVTMVAISDYGKGFFSPSLLQAVIKKALSFDIPIITDPKGSDFKRYEGTTIIKPNLSEAYAAANLAPHSSLELVAAQLFKQTNASLVMITRSESGISLFHANGQREDFQTNVKDVKDVTGAGDTVLAMFAYALANKLSPQEGVVLCNAAAGIAIETVGCARVNMIDLAVRLCDSHLLDKIFHVKDLFILQASLHGKNFNLMILKEDCTVNHALLLALRQASKENILLIHIESDASGTPLIDMLVSLREVAAIALGKEFCNVFANTLKPQSVYYFDEVSQAAQTCEAILSSEAILLSETR